MTPDEFTDASRRNNGCAALWVEKIKTHIADAQRKRATSHASSKDIRYAKIFLKNIDGQFEAICGMLNLDMRWLQKGLRARGII